MKTITIPAIIKIKVDETFLGPADKDRLIIKLREVIEENEIGEMLASRLFDAGETEVDEVLLILRPKRLAAEEGAQ